MKVTEFWLDGPPRLKGAYRVTLGELIDAADRQALRPENTSMTSYQLGGKSGSIGYMDLRKSWENIPKEGTDGYDLLSYENREVLLILEIGIEPDYRRKGYATLLKQRAEEIAKEWGLDTVVGDNLTNEEIRRLNAKLGYQLFADGTMAVKRLKQE